MTFFQTWRFQLAHSSIEIRQLKISLGNFEKKSPCAHSICIAMIFNDADFLAVIGNCTIVDDHGKFWSGQCWGN